MTDKPKKAPKAPKAPKVEAAAVPVVKAATEKKATEKLLNEQFDAIKQTLLKTHEGKKQPRQLRWALKSLEAAEDAAQRHVKHNA
jgi:ATP-dependent Lon protease